MTTARRTLGGGVPSTTETIRSSPARSSKSLITASSTPSWTRTGDGSDVFAVVGVGILLMIIGAAMLGRAARRSRVAPAWAAWLFAVAVPLFALSGFMLEAFQPAAGLLIAASATAVARGASTS